MSQIHFDTPDRRHVTTGWDPRLGEFFLTVQDRAFEERAADLEAAGQGELIEELDDRGSYSSMSESNPLTREAIIDTLQALHITPPEDLYELLGNHEWRNVANEVCTYRWNGTSYEPAGPPVTW